MRHGGHQMARRKRRRKRNRYVLSALVVVLGAAGGWYFWPTLTGGYFAASSDEAGPMSAPAVAAAVPIAVIGEAPEVVPAGDDRGGSKSLDNLDKVGGEPATTARNDDRQSDAANEQAQPAFVSSNEPPQPLANGSSREPTPNDDFDEDASAGPERSKQQEQIDALLKKYATGRRVEARGELNRMLSTTTDDSLQRELRRHLQRIADEMVFSRDIIDNDPLFERYEIQPGEYLLTIGKKFKVPYEFIMSINGIRDAGRIRAGQRIKVPHGPFHARIHRSAFRLDLYLQDVFVRSFPVALGRDSGTPLGKWKVGQRLTNPTYYPPASAENKEIIAADDPSNPLGEHWIALIGIEGDAVGQEGFGIHGTIEPDSIGKAASAGCVRMRNEDVALVYQTLQTGASTVLILP
ncbi:MAG: LysM peptidoglycan-binding domain-containing protein [Planctomycetota bacterium]|nr:MAG: LysM peptidoglycan-binding domain-containing protein [Planctomycetota bacterium]